MSLQEALSKAYALNLDLIEIVPGAQPPVCRIMSFDKYRYQKEKEFKKQRVKVLNMKEVQVSGRAAKNDMITKIKKLEGFLAKGHRVQITLTLRGREKANRPWAEQKLREFLGMITVPHKIVQTVKPGGRGLVVHIST